MNRQYNYKSVDVARQLALDAIYHAAVYRYPHTTASLDDTIKLTIAGYFGTNSWNEIPASIREELLEEYQQWLAQYPYPTYPCSHCIKLLPESEANIAVAAVEDISIGSLFLCEVCKHLFTAGQALHHVVLVEIPRSTA